MVGWEIGLVGLLALQFYQMYLQTGGLQWYLEL